jgi:hypothetical protein
VDEGRQDRPLPEVARGGAVERTAWKIEQPIALPPRGPIAYLDIERRDGSLDDIRIVDRGWRQVPYIVESEPRHRRLPLTFRTEVRAGETILRLDGIDAERTIEAFELEASSPDFFARDVSVLEQLTDDRGETEPRPIGAARWVKAAGQPAVPFRVAVSASARRDVTIRIVDGDNAPLGVSKVTADVTRRRLNFVFEESDELRLLSAGNSALAPTYDLALIAERVLSSPAEPATLGPPHPLVAAPKKTPPWFWIFVFAAAIILLIAMARTLKQTM